MREGFLVFFVGTVAEYIKLFPIIEEAKKQSAHFKVIVSGQNEIKDTDIAKKTSLKIDLQLSSEEDIVKNVFGLFYWFFKTVFSSKKKIKNAFSDVDFENSVMVVHGDTLSTVMGAVLAKKLKMKLAHVEAGLRSHHLLEPFPEEIDRLIVSKKADIDFCQGDLAVSNLKNSKGQVINTKYNTIIDAIGFAEKAQGNNPIFEKLNGVPYGVFVIHRQENLLKKHLVNSIVEKAIEISKDIKIVFVLHQITENTLKKYNLYDRLCENENILITRRMDYFDFTKVLMNSSFVITDGGSNQEELNYMGKPTLVLRTATERNEGLGKNAVMYDGDFERISEFSKTYTNFACDKTVPDFSPSECICNHLIEIQKGGNKNE